MTPWSRRARWPIRGCPRSVTFHQRGYAGQKATLTVRDGGKVLARTANHAWPRTAQMQTENLLFNAGAAGAKTLQFSIDPLPGEENRDNNTVTRLVNVESDKRRILYMEGEPRWEYKFIRRAEDDDQHRAGRLHAAHHAKTRSTARESTIPRNWPTAFRRAPRIFSPIRD